MSTPSSEWGLFNDEGLVEQDFWSAAEAAEALIARYDAEDDLRVAEVCPQCRGGQAEGCENCGDEL
jgi:hypothetical protein